MAQLQPDVVNFSAGISACARGIQWQIALRVFSEMSTMQVLAHLGQWRYLWYELYVITCVDVMTHTYIYTYCNYYMMCSTIYIYIIWMT